ncbi:hypothetical protein [Bradyrhizobium sp. CCGUVB23]|uniref:hypothetical protein n=1 Tax=Bradyrhizobium sp. CCGUVB23 TaxID=2949630 RepID=UPI0020B317F2|nr:hypothetical protein [Bradyrhizobium sp. CCGUVB23]MCP3468321.1 hypothetical protein [Bradyrhizobium sp. CCGUVB23]
MTAAASPAVVGHHRFDDLDRLDALPASDVARFTRFSTAIDSSNSFACGMPIAGTNNQQLKDVARITAAHDYTMRLARLILINARLKL